MSEITNIIFKALWEALPHPSSDHVLRLFARSLDGGRVIGDFARSPEEIKRFVDGAEGMNIYCCPNPTKRMDGVRHTSNDVTHWSWLFFDVDPMRDEENPNPELALDEFLIAFSNYSGHDIFQKHRPTIIDSGRGMQAWLRGVDIEFGEETVTRKQASKIMNYWLKKVVGRVPISHGCKLDVSVSDLPRPMRLPGTVNQKTGKTSHLVHVQDKSYPWLFPFLIWGTPNEVLVEQEIILMPGARWQDVFSRLTPSAQEYLTKGICEPGRHKRVFHTAKSLAEIGIDSEETKRAILRANKLKGEDEELELKDIEHAIKMAYQENT